MRNQKIEKLNMGVRGRKKSCPRQRQMARRTYPAPVPGSSRVQTRQRNVAPPGPSRRIFRCPMWVAEQVAATGLVRSPIDYGGPAGCRMASCGAGFKTKTEGVQLSRTRLGSGLMLGFAVVGRLVAKGRAAHSFTTTASRSLAGLVAKRVAFFSGNAPLFMVTGCQRPRTPGLRQ